MPPFITTNQIPASITWAHGLRFPNSLVGDGVGPIEGFDGGETREFEVAGAVAVVALADDVPAALPEVESVGIQAERGGFREHRRRDR